MGKSNRIRANRAKREVVSLDTKKQKKGMPSWLMTVLAIVLTLAILLSVAGLLLSSNGVFNRLATAVSTEHFKVNANMLSYYYYTQYQNFLSEQEDYLSYYSLDQSKSLKSQRFGGPEETEEGTFYYDVTLGDFEGSWFDYFMDQTVASVSSLLVYCEGAYERGITLEDADLEQIDASLTSIATTASLYGYASVDSYLSAAYGKGVKEKDVRKAMEYSALATKCMTELSNEITDAITDTDIDEKYEADPQKFLLVDYSYYTFSVTYAAAKKQAGLSDTADSALTTEQKTKIANEYQAMIRTAKDNAEKIEKMTSVKDVNDFVIGYVAENEVANAWTQQTMDVGNNATVIKAAIITEIKNEILAGNTKSEPIKDNATIKELKLSDKIMGQLETVKSTAFAEVFADKELYLCEKVNYVSKDDKVSVWAFDSKTKAGDTKLITDGDEKAEVKSTSKYSVSAYFLAKTPYRDEEKTRDIAYMLFTDEDAAKAAVDKLMKMESVDLDAFEDLAEEIEADAHTNLENYVKGSLQSNTFDTWLYADETKVGTYTAAPLKLEDGSTFCVALYCGEGDTNWYVSVKNAIANERYQAEVEELTETYEVTVKENALDRVDA